MPTVAETVRDLAKKLGRLITRPGSAVSTDPPPEFVSDTWKFIMDSFMVTSDQRSEIQKLRDMYNGDQIQGTGLNAGEYYIPQWPDETTDEQDTRAERMEFLKWNRIRDGVHTHSDALYAWGRERAISRTLKWPDGSTVSESDRTWWEEYFQDRFWPKNGFTMFMWDLWTTVGSERSAVVMAMWLDGSKRRLRRFKPPVSMEEMKDDGVVWLEKLDNLQIIVLPDSTQVREMGGIIRWYADPESDANDLGFVPSPGNGNTITELITDDLWLRFKGTDLVKHQWGFENRYGDVRSMFSWIRNPADIADSEDAISGQVLLVEHLYGAWEIKRNHAFPETLYRGYEPPVREENGRKILLRGPNVAHVAQDAGADIIKVGPPAGIGDMGVAESEIHQMMDEAMGVSEIERGGGGNLGQLRSAPALGKMMSKSERRRRRKLLAADKGEQDIFASVRDVTVYHAFPDDQRKAVLSAGLIVVFPEDAFTMDQFSEAQKSQIELDAGMTLLEDEIRKRNPQLSENELQAKVKEAKAAKAAEAAARKPNQNPQSRSQSQA